LQKSVAAEPLEEFIFNVCSDERKLRDLQETLMGVEKYSQTTPNYSPLPLYLYFNPGPADTAQGLVVKLLQALRVSTSIVLPNYVRIIDNEQIYKNRTKVNAKDVHSFNVNLGHDYPADSVILNRGEAVKAFDVVVAASDEPDFGLDACLFENSPPMPYSSRDRDLYGFGNQPFTNNEFPVGTTANFHLGFFHEKPIIKALAADFVEHSYIEHRIKQYLELSKFAFRNKHDYWGYRFMGWGLHYIQDLAVPYHTRLTPDHSTMEQIICGILYAVGSKDALEYAVTKTGRMHLALETYVYCIIYILQNQRKRTAANMGSNQDAESSSSDPQLGKKTTFSFFNTYEQQTNTVVNISPCGCHKNNLKGSHKNHEVGEVVLKGDNVECITEYIRPFLAKIWPKEESFVKYSDKMPREVISKISYHQSSEVAALLEICLPPKYTMEFGKFEIVNPREINLYNMAFLNPIISKILFNAAIHSRAYIRACLGPVT